MTSIEEKVPILKGELSALESVVVAFSGGVDSTFLLKMCCDVLGEKVLAVTADSPIHPARELPDAVKIAGSFGVKHLVLQSKELENPRFTANSPDRCYHCKVELFKTLRGLAASYGILNVVEGSNLDDLGDHRPGMRAAAELGIRQPLQEAGLTKAEIRAISKDLGLPTWNKPSMACLASRIPYGTPITREALAMIDSAEDFIRSLGIKQVRVRHYGHMARIEVEPQDIEKLAREDNRHLMLDHLKGLGYLHVTLDLAGYRTGSLDEGVTQ